MNEEQELAALEAELAALEAEAQAVSHEPEPEPVKVAEEPKPKKKKSPKVEDIKPEAIDPKAEAIRQYGAARLRAKQASKGLR